MQNDKLIKECAEAGYFDQEPAPKKKRFWQRKETEPMPEFEPEEPLECHKKDFNMGFDKYICSRIATVEDRLDSLFDEIRTFKDFVRKSLMEKEPMPSIKEVAEKDQPVVRKEIERLKENAFKQEDIETVKWLDKYLGEE